MSVQDCVEERMLVYLGIAYHGYGLWTWYFSEGGELYYTNCPHEKELQTFFYLGKCLDYAVSQKDQPEIPFLMSDSLGLVWLGEYIAHPGMERRFMVVGPAFQDRSSIFGISDELARMNISQNLQREYLGMLRELPVVSLQQFHSLAKSLHYVNCFVDTSDLKIKMQNFEAEKEREVWGGKPVDYEQANHREKMLLQFVRDGNPGYGNVFDIFSHFEEEGSHGQSPVRNVKNRILIFADQCAHTAMDGGVPVNTAKEMENDFIGRIERLRTVTALTNLCREMVDAFVSQVAQHQTDMQMSKAVHECCAYIKSHLSEPLTLKGLARHMGYTEYYLTRKFQKETGVKLLDYIKETRLDYAKILLSTTNLSIQQISEKLQFGTRNYFTRIFKEYMDISPMEYRRRAWGGQEE